MKIRWLEPFNGKEVGHVGDVPDSKGKFWCDRGMAEEVKPPKPKTKTAPKRKVIEGPEVKK